MNNQELTVARPQGPTITILAVANDGLPRPPFPRHRPKSLHVPGAGPSYAMQ